MEIYNRVPVVIQNIIARMVHELRMLDVAKQFISLKGKKLSSYDLFEFSSSIYVFMASNIFYYLKYTTVEQKVFKLYKNYNDLKECYRMTLIIGFNLDNEVRYTLDIINNNRHYYHNYHPSWFNINPYGVSDVRLRYYNDNEI